MLEYEEKKRVNVSFPKSILNKIDMAAKAVGKNRSHYLIDAALNMEGIVKTFDSRRWGVMSGSNPNPVFCKKSAKGTNKSKSKNSSSNLLKPKVKGSSGRVLRKK
jgi:hypothetical protein